MRPRPTPAAPARFARAPRAGAPTARVPAWRGAAGALALAAWTVVGVLGAAVALLPLALEDGPRGRARRELPPGRRPRPAPLPVGRAAPARAAAPAREDAPCASGS